MLHGPIVFNRHELAPFWTIWVSLRRFKCGLRWAPGEIFHGSESGATWGPWAVPLTLYLLHGGCNFCFGFRARYAAAPCNNPIQDLKPSVRAWPTSLEYESYMWKVAKHLGRLHFAALSANGVSSDYEDHCHSVLVIWTIWESLLWYDTSSCYCFFSFY